MQFFQLDVLSILDFLNADINECAEKMGLCEQECINAPGSYMCACKQGYRLIGKSRCEGNRPQPISGFDIYEGHMRKGGCGGCAWARCDRVTWVTVQAVALVDSSFVQGFCLLPHRLIPRVLDNG